MLDSDQSGTISPEEFVAGINRLKGQAKGKDLVQLTSFINRAVRRVKMLTLRVERLIDKADTVLGRLDTMWAVTEQELKERQFAVKRQTDLQRRIAEKEKILKRLDQNQAMKFPRLASRQSVAGGFGVGQARSPSRVPSRSGARTGPTSPTATVTATPRALPAPPQEPATRPVLRSEPTQDFRSPRGMPSSPR